ncbi:Exodeoxyribonuclease VII large subunit [Acetitomaculum ruminis DSM 5522]|uniref:Exodeoxyribonuclease 7 large subunit n=1 Tax=Acetitomaculum ruminis DSM 5522 TaxID=1120918 RepID=A0A1I0VU19_9FIRM|nr:exodeoxyribonuclease VII large subunit [Acetitomaculum ruminis]SFA79527.1 Exodeoxyribonuclease VII large subunit [Acetitomaculum ruminis DSM 5522]
MEKAYSVSQINGYIKSLFEQDFILGNAVVKGEISNCKYHSSGHIYFTLKDEKSTINAIMFSSYRSGLDFRMSEGQQVLVRGSIRVFDRDGKYQIYAREITLDGQGDLYKKFEQLKAELLEMGMFDEMYKVPIPVFIKKLGVVTAPTGAAIRDIINITKRRNPFVEIILYPAKVQGEGAAYSITKGIQALNNLGVDTIIVGRGGGSIEDLWAFNEEIVARAIFDSKVPVISAVGHETDFTIADFVADLRAPTPSAAAELAVYSYEGFLNTLKVYKDKLDIYEKNIISDKRLLVDSYKNAFRHLNPENIINDKKMYLLSFEDKLKYLMNLKLSNEKSRLSVYIERLKGLSPLEKLSSGFSYVSDEKGNMINSINNVEKGDCININVKDGSIKAKVVDKIRETY